jgi:excisionase family DNA binding protein
VIVDLGPELERIKTELLEQLRAELRAEREPWPAWMSVATAARYLDCSEERLRKLVARQEIPFSQEAVGCRISFSRIDLDAWMASLGAYRREGGAITPA